VMESETVFAKPCESEFGMVYGLVFGSAYV